MKQRKGFTLIEILVVTTIIAVLAVGAFVSFASAGKSARDSRRKTDLETVRQALVLYKAENGCYPASTYTYTTMTALLVTNGYLSNPAPSDPKPATYSYTYTAGAGACAATFTLSVSPNLENLAPYSVVNP